MRGFGLVRLCGVDGGVRVRDGLSFSILKVDDEKEKGDAQLGCQERGAKSRAFAWPRAGTTLSRISFVNRLRPRLDWSIDLHPIQPDIPHQRPLQTIGSASRNATRRTGQTLRKDRKEHR
jgi:hypothetical protein